MYFQVPDSDQWGMLGLRKNLPAKERINAVMVRLYETGILEYAKNKFSTHQVPNCHEFGSVGYKEVSMGYVYGAYVVLGAGYGVALLLCLLEKAVIKHV